MAPPSRAAGAPAPRPRRWVAASAALVSGLVGVSQVLGFLRDAVNAWAFGASGGYDAFLVAQGLMNLVLGLVTSAMAKATVPTVSRAVERGESARGLHTARVGLTVAVSVLAAGSVLMWWAAPLIVTVLAPGFDDATAVTAVEMTRIVVVATVFIAGTNILAATAQAHRKFAAAAVQGVPFNLTMIAAAAVFGHVFGVRAIAVGFVVGSALRFLLQVPTVRRLGMSLRPSFDVRDNGFREIRRLVPLLLVGSAVGNINTLVDRAVGSLVGAGVISSLSYGYRLVQLPYQLLVVTLATVLYPALGAVSTPGRRSELRRLVHRGIGMLTVILAPVVALLIVAGRELVIVLFERGDFDRYDVSRTSTAVACFAVGLFGLGAREVLARACYALGDARGPVTSTVVAVAVNVVGDLTLGLRFGVAGLAASTSLSLLVAAGLLALRMRRRHDALHLGEVMPGAAVCVAAAAVAGVVAAVVVAVVGKAAGLGSHPGTLGALALCLVAFVAVVGPYLASLRLARRPEVDELADLGRGLLRRIRPGR